MMMKIEESKELVVEGITKELDIDYELTSFSKNVGSNRWRRDPNNGDLSIADDFDFTKDYYTVGSWKTEWPKLYSYVIDKGKSSDLSVAIANFLKTYCENKRGE